MHRSLQTPRLRLCAWGDRDLAPFATRNADPRVMAFLPKLLDRAESDALVYRIRDHVARYGVGLWAVKALDAAGRGGCGRRT
jgi:RimJ/RimL family protein N-acetyltransferase